ncbi:SRPBCC family protein [Fodinicola feengrottensis]|uniref:Activator of Hsp90 ATPase homologue 1/2-like C-terminal domain-containing protein n=1 Tax=Fodinicola feengrottensis TaxID=435914 RepID=A0ABN2GH50_9ACTN|nr:SRPBCC family protein [Fodinicola feengrottensis]
MATEDGTYVQVEGRPAVRFRRNLRHPAAKVWAAISEPSELKHWFPAAVTIEPQQGGTITFGDDPNVPDRKGEILVYEPPRRLAFTWGASELRFEIEPDGDQRCWLTLIDVLENTDTAARNAAGWHVCLAELDKAINGEPGGGPHADTAERWHPLYEAYVAGGMPSGAPIPGL